MKRFYSILRVSNPQTGLFSVAVCETQQDERDVIRCAEIRGFKVTNIVAAEDTSCGIVLNDFDLTTL